MSPGARLAAAFRHLGAVIGVRLTRVDDGARRDRHGDSLAAINDRMTAFATEVETRATVRSDR